jgi:hypothetical protein
LIDPTVEYICPDMIEIDGISRRDWTRDRHPLPGGTHTNWPIGSIGYVQEFVLARTISEALEPVGYGRIIQIAEQIVEQYKKRYEESLKR